MSYITLALASLLPIAVYLTVGLLPTSKAENESEYFIFGQRVIARDYANTSVAYALQMAAIFLFADWGARYGLGALWTILFWLVGFIVLYALLPRFLHFHAQGATTLHQYLAQRFNAGPRFQRLAAVATIVGLWGTMMSEVDYTVQIYGPFVASEWVKVVLIAILLLFGTMYTVRNGFKAEVITERFQVPIAYSALLLLLILLLPSVWSQGGSVIFSTACVLLLLIFSAQVYGKFQTGLGIRRDPQILIPIFGLLGLATVIIYTLTTRQPGHLITVLNKPISEQFRAQGLIGLLSLFVANAFWMPVDLSTWQRIASVEGTGESLLNSLKRGTKRVIFESPASWILGVVIGLIINGLGLLNPTQDPSEGINTFANGLNAGTIPGIGPHLTQQLLYPLLIVGAISIMFSTVNALTSAISFTAYRDLPGKQGTTGSLSSAKKWTVGIVLVGLVAYLILRAVLGANLATFLYSAYASQLSLFVVALLALIGRQRETRAAKWSLLGGLLTTGIVFLIAMRTGDPRVAVLPPLFAVVGACAGYILGFNRKNVILNES